MFDALSPAALPALLAGGGLAAVLAGTLALRQHALVVLVVAGLGVMWLTPRENVVRAEAEATAERFAVRAVGEEANSGGWVVQSNGVFMMGQTAAMTAYRPGLGGGLGEPVASLKPDQGTQWDWKFPRHIDGDALVRTEQGDYVVTPYQAFLNINGRVDNGGGWPLSPQPQATPGLLKPGDLLVAVEDQAVANATASLAPPARFAAAFGDTAADIGLLIALASVLGAGLTHSGAAERLVRALLSTVGPRGHPAAFCAGSLALGVPVFFDAVFLLCAPLAKSTALRTGRGPLLLLLSVCCGGALTHSLAPPTPGPLLVAAELDVSIPLMIGVGLGISVATAPLCLLWCWWRVRRWERRGEAIPVREGAGASLGRLRELAERPAHELPPLWASLLPLAVPVFLIAQKAAWEMAVPRSGTVVVAGLPVSIAAPPVQENWRVPMAIVEALGDPTIAVLAGTLISLFLLWRYTAPLERKSVVADAVAEGGGILLVAAAGGAFGTALRQTGVGGLIAAAPELDGLGLLALAWGISLAVRTAQGSATVAMVVAAGLVAAAIPASGLHPVWVACAIGCGSKAVLWLNSSGFWVICRAGGLTEREALATVTPLTVVMAVVGLGATLTGAWLWPGV
ncbi:GntP family permease [Alienimonas californiensis]|uniref:Gnt-II system L-idonate transporter n=1 Tax=Alienimonas californiensis TaxID=2527989 RepID=A0A517P682_9PLAN|nr:SLC13 family permease [Alienimonas californiensis]QDT14856.1 Gnt-II system L-idonate transporter [Alienimonas californiensis]